MWVHCNGILSDTEVVFIHSRGSPFIFVSNVSSDDYRTEFLQNLDGCSSGTFKFYASRFAIYRLLSFSMIIFCLITSDS